MRASPMPQADLHYLRTRYALFKLLCLMFGALSLAYCVDREKLAPGWHVQTTLSLGNVSFSNGGINSSRNSLRHEQTAQAIGNKLWNIPQTIGNKRRRSGEQYRKQ